ncbi:hypothetical protein WKI72_18500 [Candidatus Erwinia dacicola]
MELINIDGVKVTMESGIHKEYTFPKEVNYSRSINNRLSNQFGIYFFVTIE